MRGIGKQRRSGSGFEHLPHRAAAVDVDKIGFVPGRHTRRIGHDSRVRPKDLYAQRPLCIADMHEFKGFLISTNDSVRTHHLGKGKPRTESPSHDAEGIVSHTRKRCKEEVVRYDKTAYVYVFQEGHAVIPLYRRMLF